MQKHPGLTRERIRLFAEKGLRPLVYPRRAPVTLSVHASADRIGYAEALRGEYRPARVGEVLGPAWSTHWFRVEAAIPAEWAGQEVHLLWDSSSEACVWQDGQPRQGLTGSPPSPQGREPIRSAYRLAQAAQGGEHPTLLIEAACNTLFGNDSPYHEYSLKQAEIAVFDQDAWDLLWDFTIIADMARHLPANTPRGGQALHTANQMVNLIRLDDRATWSAARAVGAEFLSAHNGDGQHNLSAIGHAHIDTAWLWPLAETRRKCVRTFSSVMRLMEDYPEFKFACSQAQQLAWIKEMEPALFGQIVMRAREGRFVVAGGTWVEPDCNLPSGESLVRQFLYGQRFFRQEFGAACREFWNPDVFGYSAALPQIMRGAGMRYFLTQKLSWNQFNAPANQTFLWEGLDGSQVLTHFPPADTYNSMANVEEALRNSNNFKEHDRGRESYLLFGFGDGGGGPTREMLEQLRRMRDVDGLPRMQIRAPQDFFARCEADVKEPVTWVGELYFEAHRGTYTTQANNKRDNRRAELLLRDVELLAALAYATGRADYPGADLGTLWKLVLLNQFHDILPGSSITEVYAGSSAQYADVLDTSARLRSQALESLLPTRLSERSLLAFNTLSAERIEVVELPIDLPGLQRSASGRPLALISAPPMGFTRVTADMPIGEAVCLSETPDAFMLENQWVRATVGRDGHLSRLWDKRAGREAIVRGSAGNQFVLFDDEPVTNDAWDVDIFHLEKRDNVGPAQVARVTETGPLRAAVRFDYAIGARSRLSQTVSLTCASPRLDFDTQVDWHEQRRFLKVEFPFNVRSESAAYEIQFGHVRRPTHFNTSWDLARFEVCAHRWADLSEPGFGVALLNDCKYGYATHRNVMRLSLLRSVGVYPDPSADLGQHHFRYALLPHPGTLYEAGVIDEGYRFNVPLLLHTGFAPVARQAFFTVDSPNVVIDTVKKAEDSGALVVRLYEAHGSRGPVRLASTLPVQSAIRCNLLEEDEAALEWEDGGVAFEVSPFQIITVRLVCQGIQR